MRVVDFNDVQREEFLHQMDMLIADLEGKQGNLNLIDFLSNAVFVVKYVYPGGEHHVFLNIYIDRERFKNFGGIDSRNRISTFIKNRLSDFFSNQNFNLNKVMIETLPQNLSEGKGFIKLKKEQDQDRLKIIPIDNKIIIKDPKKVWDNENHYKLFISHQAIHAQKLGKLSEYLFERGISCFLAHKDIHGGDDWLEKIKYGLFTMDGLLAYLTDDFMESKWTSQEIGFAVAKNSPIISIKAEKLDPYGFMPTQQAFSVKGGNLMATAEEIYKHILKEHGEKYPILKEAEKYIKGRDERKRAIEAFANSEKALEIDKNLKALARINNFPPDELDELVKIFNENLEINRNHEIQKYFFDFLQKRSNDAYEKIGDYEIRRIEG